MQYATFSGVIPKGQYGAGTMEIWDHGSYELVERKRDGGLTVRLDGERLQGLWTLVPAHMGGDEKNWLRDQEARLAGAGRPGGAGRLRADAGDPRRPAARSRALAARGEVGRLPGGGAARGRRRLAHQPPRRRHGCALRRRGAGAAPRAAHLRLRGRRRAVHAGRGRPAQLRADAAGGGIARLLPVRPARAGAAAADRPAAGAASRAAGRAAGRGKPAGAAVGRVRGRGGAAAGRRRAGSGGGGRQAAGLDLPTGTTDSGLGEGEDAAGWRVSGHWLDGRPGVTRGAGRAGAGRGRRRRPGLGRQRRQRPGRAQHQRAAAPDGAAACGQAAARSGAEDAQDAGPAGDLDRAAAGA